MTRRLYKSPTERVISGVAGGVADYLDADPSIVRVIWALLAIITGGVFLVIYIVMWIVVPEEPPSITEQRAEAAAGSAVVRAPAHERRRGSGGGAMVFGLILVGLGAYFLIDEYLPQIDVNAFWPIGLVVLGIVLLVSSLRRPRAE